MRWAIGLLGVAACGRFGFDAQSSDLRPADARGSDRAPDDSPGSGVAPLATCGTTPANLGAVTGADHQLEVVQTARGFVGITTDDSKAVRAWGAAIGSDGSIAAGQLGGAPLALPSDGGLGVAPAGTGALVASTSGGNTFMQSVDALGAPVGAPLERAGDAAAEHPLAASGVDGALGFATVAGNGEIAARVVDATGADADVAHVLVPASIGAGEFQLEPAGAGYAATWTDSTQSPSAKMVAVFGPDFATVAGPVAASTGTHGAENGQIAWAATSQTYLAVWQDKVDSGAEEVNIRLFDASLTPLAASSSVILDNTGGPKVTSDGTGFFLTARSYDPDGLAIRYIAADGTVTVLPYLDMNGNAEVWASATRETQPATAWVDDAVYIDVPCP